MFSYLDIFTNATVTGLDPGQIAQIGWIVRTGPVNDQGRVPIGHHAFILGRLQNGEWFLSDQGTNPATEFIAPTIDMLSQEITQASRSGTYWIYMGVPDGILGWTGVRMLAGGDAVRELSSSLIPNGIELAEVDAGALTIGDTITSGDFVTTVYSNNDALSAVGGVGTNNGAVIVEMPRGVFFVYKTNTVSTTNITADIDTSAGGLLINSRLYYGAQLMITDGNSGRLIRVY